MYRAAQPWRGAYRVVFVLGSCPSVTGKAPQMETLIILLALLFGAMIAIGLALLGMQLVFSFVPPATPVAAGLPRPQDRAAKSSFGGA